MPPFPVARYLTAAAPPPPDERFALVEETITGGLPHTIVLDTQLALVVSLPTGLATRWSDAAADDLVSSSAAETAPQPVPASPQETLQRAPLRFYVRRAGRTIGVVPAIAGLRALVPDGSPSDGVHYEIRVLDWDLHVGSVRGAGNVGSRVKVAWRRADVAVMQYSQLPVEPHLWWRLPLLNIARIESWVALRIEPPRTLAASLVLRRGNVNAAAGLRIT